MSACLQQLVEAMAGLVAVRVVGDDRHAKARQPPAQRSADGAEAHQARGASGDLAAAEPLVGDGSVAKHLARADVRFGRQQVAGGREQQCDGHLGDRVGVAPRRVQNRNPRGGRAGNVDVVGVTSGGGDRPQWKLEHRPANRIGFHHKHIGALRVGARGQLFGGVDP